jgi:hypothetical protein
MMMDDDEEGEVDESGAADQSEEVEEVDASAEEVKAETSEAGEDADDYDDQVPDEDNLDTNIEAKRDKMISDLLSKEDLGII